MNAFIAPSHVIVQCDSATEGARLEAAYRLPNPEWAEAVRRGAKPFHRVKGRWERIPEYREAWTRGAYMRQYHLPRGCAADFGLRVERPPLLPEPCGHVAELRDYQIAPRDALLSGDGYVVLPCGAGKTTIALSAAARLPGPVCVLVHTLDLKRQWEARAKEYGLADVVDVVTVQSAARWTPEAWAARREAYSAVIMDECAHCPASTFAGVISRFTAPWRWGLTATPERADGLGKFLDWYIGPRLATVPQCVVQEAGYSVVPRLERITWPYLPDVPQRRDGTLDWAALVSGLAADPERNAEVVRLATAAANDGCTVLVLTSRVEHVEALAALMPGSVALHGGKAKRLRADGLQALQEGRARIGIATQLADEGLDLPRLDCLVLALPSRSQARTVQRVGRIMRPSPGKAGALVYDLVDDCAPCWGQWASRKRAYRAAGVRI